MAPTRLPRSFRALKDIGQQTILSSHTELPEVA
jgi:hypothetical protein